MTKQAAKSPAQQTDRDNDMVPLKLRVIHIVLIGVKAPNMKDRRLFHIWTHIAYPAQDILGGTITLSLDDLLEHDYLIVSTLDHALHKKWIPKPAMGRL